METKWIRNLFSFSKKERNGILVLLMIIFCLIVTGKLMPLLFPTEKTDFSQWEKEVNNFYAKTEKDISTGIPLSLVPFNPNEADSIFLKKMGIPAKIASNWSKYLSKGGRFREKTDVKKLFGMTASLFDQIEPYIIIGTKDNVPVRIKAGNPIQPKEETKRDTTLAENHYKTERKIAIVLELNSADSVHLLAINGIGPVFASRIIRYRNLLGGYYIVSQLKEIYGMKPENYASISQFFTVDPTVIKTFNINFSTVQELGRHPYIGFKTARTILKLRDKNGKFLAVSDLSAVLSSDSLQKLSPYLKFNQ